jgi:hypothetical protein
MQRWSTIAAAGVLGLLWAGCGGDNGSPTAPSTALSAEVRVALDRSIQDEYLAETTYQAVITDHGSVLPFINIVIAERQHIASVGQLYVSRNLAVPASTWSASTVPHYATVQAACAGGAAAERANIALYDELLRLDLPSDVRTVFTSLRAASLMNHLPAFESCS